jgi:hypothetical protein
MIRHPRYAMEEHARKGRELYHVRIEPLLGEELRGKIVALDIDSSEFELGEKVLDATDKLLTRLPDAQIWCERIGYPAVYNFGSHSGANKP